MRPEGLDAQTGALFERSPDGWLLVDGTGTIQVANAAARAILACESALEGTPARHWLPKVPTSEPVSIVETHMVSTKGDEFPAEVTIVPLPEAGGRVWVMFRDITLRKGFEGSVRHHADELERMVQTRREELSDLRDRYRRLYDLVPVLDFELDSQDAIASANRKACVALGVTKDRLVGLPLADLALPAEQEQLAEQLAKMRTGSMRPYETRLRNADGSLLDVVFHAARENESPRSAMRVVGLDVTARREAERLVDQSLELAEAQRARMERILRGIGDGVVVTDPDGQIRLMNPIAEKFLDIDEQFAFGRNLFAEQRDVHFAETWDAFVAGEDDVLNVELTIGKAASNQVFAVTLSRIRTPEGRPAGCVAVLRDVTTERHVERMKRDFVSNITHELRTPLASIRGFTATLLRGGQVGSGDQTRFLQIVEKEAERLQHLIEGLLTLSSLESGREALDLQPGDFSLLLDDIREVFLPLAQEKGISLEIQSTGANGAGIFDPQRMRRVLDNLIGNALKFTSSGGEIRVDFRREGDCIVCRVADTGRGIPADRIERIFDRFYSSSKSPTGNPAGSGLGLHIVQRLLELHDGAISVESELGRGTTFEFRIPAVPRTRESSETRPRSGVMSPRATPPAEPRAGAAANALAGAADPAPAEEFAAPPLEDPETAGTPEKANPLARSPLASPVAFPTPPAPTPSDAQPGTPEDELPPLPPSDPLVDDDDEDEPLKFLPKNPRSRHVPNLRSQPPD